MEATGVRLVDWRHARHMMDHRHGCQGDRDATCLAALSGNSGDPLVYGLRWDDAPAVLSEVQPLQFGNTHSAMGDELTIMMHFMAVMLPMSQGDEQDTDTCTPCSMPA